MMTDEEFIPAALALLGDDTINATLACAAIQSRDGKRLTPGVVIDIARALDAPPAPVLALMGWISSTADRQNRRAFFDIFTQVGEPRYPTDREHLAALALAKTIART